ncbi:MAG: hypothetical protein JF603_14430 [Acidobacteria bacterium]|nr:hypothetical protein [Acidobacteriota bacterium]
MAALGGAGTFASFSASTSNDASFQTVHLSLKNTVGATTCTSPAGLPGSGTGGVATAAVDTNDASGCAALFPTVLKAGVEATADVVVANDGGSTGGLYLFAPAACVVSSPKDLAFNAGSAATSTAYGANPEDLCKRVVFSVEVGGACVWPTTGGACPTLGDTSTSDYSFAKFGDDHTFSGKLTAFSALVSGTPQTFHVKAYMKTTLGCTRDSDTDVNTTGTDGVKDGFTDTKGIGCDNIYQNQKAALSLRWLMQA